MKESIGGTWLLGIAALFLVLFSAFIAYSINYTKAFRAKNEILNIIEQNEGYTPYEGSLIENASDETLDLTTQGQIYKLIKSLGYDYGTERVKCNDDGYEGRSEPGGYCIYKFESKDGTVRYKVTTYVIMKFPVINFGIQVPIKGETKTMYYDVDKSIKPSEKIDK